MSSTFDSFAGVFSRHLIQQAYPIPQYLYNPPIHPSITLHNAPQLRLPLLPRPLINNKLPPPTHNPAPTNSQSPEQPRRREGPNPPRPGRPFFQGNSPSRRRYWSLPPLHPSTNPN
ncbi:hypothetical protein L873DRAFT_1802996 [Choiromyces venosus 120613-1]|uniref:Uncharacterized protein n=1 Tax=Choiromyces venosus 120613-1 TaxID=1336337 RepID=A0A3N4JX10_9PEZI|nr:hypothetical protein L873DRAFT_1802996 [Choiromyces venosus 120613-1]